MSKIGSEKMKAAIHEMLTTNANLNNNNNNYIKESNEKLLKTPSTLCNYYDKSEATTSQKKDLQNKNNMEGKNELRKNLDKLYEESKNDDIEYITVNKKNNQNIVNWKLKDSIKIKKEKEKKEDNSKTLNENKKKKSNPPKKIISNFADKRSDRDMKGSEEIKIIDINEDIFNNNKKKINYLEISLANFL